MTQLDLIPVCRAPSEGTQCYKLLHAMQCGERLTELSVTLKYNITAASQRIGDLRNKFGWPIKSRFIETAAGAHIKEYWLENTGSLTGGVMGTTTAPLHTGDVQWRSRE